MSDTQVDVGMGNCKVWYHDLGTGSWVKEARGMLWCSVVLLLGEAFNPGVSGQVVMDPR